MCTVASCPRCAITAAPDTAAWAAFRLIPPWLCHGPEGTPFPVNRSRLCQDEHGGRCTYRCLLLPVTPFPAFPACVVFHFSPCPGGFSQQVGLISSGMFYTQQELLSYIILICPVAQALVSHRVTIVGDQLCG